MCLSFAACSAAEENEDAKEAATASEATLAPAKEKVFQTSDERFELTADENWTDAEKLLEIEDATLSISKNAEGYIALISESRYNFSDKLSGYNKMVKKHMENNIDQEETGETEKIKLGKYDAYKTIITGQVDGVAQTYQIYCTEINDRYIQLICWSLDSSGSELSKEFDKIAQTLSPVEYS